MLMVYCNLGTIARSLKVENFDEFDEWPVIHQNLPTILFLNVFPMKPMVNSSKFCLCFICQSYYIQLLVSIPSVHNQS